jgi:hypothetical protein
MRAWRQVERRSTRQGGAREADAARERPNRQTSEEVRALKARDNVTNWLYLARIYLVTAAVVAGAVGNSNVKRVIAEVRQAR